ncbi:hypothetical protein KQ255_13320 [Acinetobacter baumannii]|nr:hypothetical protein [Acinetobacter baumannii]UTA10588.1 hypothetical protein KQ255_13320 [Acinetobacter baumannii]
MNKHLLAKITLLGAAQLFTFHAAFADIPLTPAQFAKAKTENFDKKVGEFKHEVRQFQKPYDNQQAEQISLMV